MEADRESASERQRVREGFKAKSVVQKRARGFDNYPGRENMAETMTNNRSPDTHTRKHTQTHP
jgi:hypothetical protein